MVRAPGNLSSGQISARTGRQTPVDGAGRPEEQGTGMAAAPLQLRRVLVNTDLSGRRGNRDIERPENAPVERFQRDGAGRPEEQGTGMAAAAWIMKTYTLQGRRPFRMNAVVASMSPLQGFQGFCVSFYRGNVSFALVVSFRARLFLFPVPC